VRRPTERGRRDGLRPPTNLGTSTDCRLYRFTVPQRRAMRCKPEGAVLRAAREFRVCGVVFAVRASYERHGLISSRPGVLQITDCRPFSRGDTGGRPMRETPGFGRRGGAGPSRCRRVAGSESMLQGDSAAGSRRRCFQTERGRRRRFSVVLVLQAGASFLQTGYSRAARRRLGPALVAAWQQRGLHTTAPLVPFLTAPDLRDRSCPKSVTSGGSTSCAA